MQLLYACIGLRQIEVVWSGFYTARRLSYELTKIDGGLCAGLYTWPRL